MEGADDTEDEDEHMDVEERAVTPDVPRRSPTPPAALPSFPIPAQPDAPSKADLALQGLDKALVNAELVDSTQVLSIPADENDGGTNLSLRTRKRLHELGITELFAVQTALLPFLLSNPSRAVYTPYNLPRDACVSAPTGSGKTLAYVTPIVEVLSSRITTRLRALVVVPTRDLVTQVKETFEAVGKGRGLKIGVVTGQHSFSHEQSQIVGESTIPLAGGSSKVDILICTPGRLIDHLNGTTNFTLQHLRFLVIDEADRLLAQSFQGWLSTVLAATTQSNAPPIPSKDSNLPRADAAAPHVVPALDFPDVLSRQPERPRSSCQKLLFSATLTQDPGKLAALNLHNPKYFIVRSKAKRETVTSGILPDVADVVMERFSMPEGLTEHMAVCDPADKPLVFFHLITTHGIRNALVFTKSAESTTRLVRLFEFFEKARAEGDSRPVTASASVNASASGTASASASTSAPITISAYSSDLGGAERRAILERFRKQEIQILVASDLISRGLDISHVSHVVSYDAPVDVRKYVHRVGRTARAGRAGSAWTLVEEQEARYFKNMMKEADHLSSLKKVKVDKKEMEELRPLYTAALERLKNVYTKAH
ncbi:DEAD-domain-containing protein [Schizophyllum commune Tattone D]|nr:DEAD-domain-containing protein [Schizophyllum commune Tattone D]